MFKEILYTTALNENDVLIDINDAEKGKEYHCPICKTQLIIKKSGKSGKGSKRPHFAHIALTPNCNPETALHYSFKKRTVELLNKYIEEKNEFELNFKCSKCTKQNKLNLLGNISYVKEEYNLKECQPDIALLDQDNKVIAVIEIVVTHQPEEKTLNYYQVNKIILFQINLTSDEDLKHITRKISSPDIIDYCQNPKCPNCVKYSITRNIIYYPTNCEKCFHKTEAYRILIDSPFGKQKLLDFTNEEIEKVRSERNHHIEVKTNFTTNERYPFFCLNCKRINLRVNNPFRF